MKARWKIIIATIVVCAVGALIAFNLERVKDESFQIANRWSGARDQERSDDDETDGNKEDDDFHDRRVDLGDLVSLSNRTPATVRLTKYDSAERLGITIESVQPAPPPDSLRLPGTLLIDPNRLVHVHTRFAGEAVTIGEFEEPRGISRRLRYGDKVQKGQVVAVVWSKEIGEKKSELVDALSRVELSQLTLKRLESLQSGVVAERQIVEARRAVEADLIAVTKAERTLRSWRIAEEEIAAIHNEVKSIRARQSNPNRETDQKWAEVEVRSPIDGVIVEKNFNVGDIVDSGDDLFKIADLSQLQVIVNVYEENLGALRNLAPEDRRWKLSVKSNDDSARPISGEFCSIGSMIDPAQRTGVVMGWLDNSKNEYSVGQFITATIELPAQDDVVAVPESALLEEGDSTSVFVEVDRDRREFTRRDVEVMRRTAGLVYVRSIAASKARLQVGDRIVTSGAISLGGELLNLVASKRID